MPEWLLRREFESAKAGCSSLTKRETCRSMRALSASVLDKTLKPNEAAFLKEKLAPAEGGAADSYDYMPFSAAVYGAGSATPVS